MASLYEILAGGLGDENYYKQQDPFYMGGAGIAQMQLPQAQTNTQAIFGPALQGLLAGSLLGYGQGHAKETAFDEARQNPLLKELYGQYRPKGTEDLIGPLTQEQELSKALAGNVDAPAGWTIGQGKQDALLSAYKMQEALDLENQIKLKEAIAPFAYGNRQFSPAVQKALAAKLGMSETETLTPQEADALYKAESLGIRQGQNERLSDPWAQTLKLMGQQGRSDLIGTSGLMAEMDSIKQDLDQFSDESSFEYQLKNKLVATDEGTLRLKLDLLGRQITKAIEGARPTDYDAETYRRIIQGDLTTSPRKIKELIDQAQTLFAKKAVGSLAGAKQLQAGTIGEMLAGYANGQGGPTPTPTPGTLTPEVYNQLRAQGKSKEEIRAMFAGQ